MHNLTQETKTFPCFIINYEDVRLRVVVTNKYDLDKNPVGEAEQDFNNKAWLCKRIVSFVTFQSLGPFPDSD